MVEEINNNEVLNFIQNYFNVENPFTIYSKSLVYKEDDIIKGILIYDEIYDRIEIMYILVLDEYRKKGIGSKLLMQLDLNKNNSLEVRKSNIIAVEFYKKNGFSIVAIRKNYYNGEDAYLMCKEVH